MSRTWRPIVGILGGATCDHDDEAAAREVGRLVAERGAVLLCGGRSGVMEAAAEGARHAGGLTLGVLPGRNASESPPNPHIEIALFTGLGDGRNYVNAVASDALIAIGGSWGTLSEIALARKAGKPVVLLRSWPGLAHPDLVRAQSPAEAVDRAFAAMTPGSSGGSGYPQGMSDLHALLVADHERLDRLFQELQDAVEGAGQPTIQEIWGRFESGLLAHMDAEEKYLLPPLEKREPELVDEVRKEHGAIRHYVAELGVTTNLHLLRKEVADRLIQSLRDHASYEDRTLYLHADEVLSDETRATFRRFLQEEGRRRYEESRARESG